MRTIKRLNDEVSAVETLGKVTQIFEEVYASRMQKVRSSVLNNRYFMENILTVFSQVKSSFKREGVKLLEKNGRSVAVLITANKKFSGNLDLEVFFSFYNFIRQNECDVIITGALGKLYYEQKGAFRSYMYFNRPEGLYKVEDLKPITDVLIKYDKVDVFYGKYYNLIKQGSTATNITGDITEFNRRLMGRSVSEKQFLFEPSAYDIFSFFELQLFASFFNQTTQESYLADLGTRLFEMETATLNSEKALKMLYPKVRRLKRRAENNKQLMSFAGISFWGKA